MIKMIGVCDYQSFLTRNSNKLKMLAVTTTLQTLFMVLRISSPSELLFIPFH